MNPLPMDVPANVLSASVGQSRDVGIESDGRDITMIECRVVLTAAKSPSTSSPAA